MTTGVLSRKKQNKPPKGSPRRAGGGGGNPNPGEWAPSVVSADSVIDPYIP
jgi:hypothetical protein